MPTVALSVDFLDSLSRIPTSQQKKVREFTEKFRLNPTARGINYEKIQGMKDKKVRTVRIGLDYRAIILHPEHGDVYVLAWVDHHDEAMAWAKDKRFEVNPSTGALQVYSVAAGTLQSSTHERPDQNGNRLFAAFDSSVLLSFGVPEILIPAVKALKDKEQLKTFAGHLPAEAMEALTWLAEGIPPTEIHESLAHYSKEEINTDDFDAALENPDTRRRFVKVESQYDLTAMLDAPLEKWRVFLHPSQFYLVAANFSGPALVLGGAGTGKTVVAMHRAKYLASDIFPNQEDRILFLTYSSNLAQNVQRNVASLSGSYGARIDVTNLHSWAVRFMREKGAEFQIASEDELRETWKHALNTGASEWDLSFVRQEWEHIVKGNELENREKYLRFPRVGRKALSRHERSRLWEIFERFHDGMNQLGKLDWLEVISATRKYLEKNKPIFPYRAVVVDETQDLHAEELRLIRTIVPPGHNDLFLVGDSHQRIYNRKVILSKCGIDVKGRISKLNINYRTTQQIREWAVNMLGAATFDDLDGGVDENQRYISLLTGPRPEVHRFETAEAERTFVEQRIRKLLADHPAEEICLVATTNHLVKSYRLLEEKMGIAFNVLGKLDEPEASGIRLSTMHRIKGLEFPCIFLVAVNDGVLPSASNSTQNDSIEKAETETRERSLLFVAATRARDKLIISSFGQPSPFLQSVVGNFGDRTLNDLQLNEHHLSF